METQRTEIGSPRTPGRGQRRIFAPVTGLLLAFGASDSQPAAAPPREAAAGQAASTYTVDVFDVGTGLSVLVRGPSWNVLFDGGSQDDYRTHNRLLPLLAAAGVHPNSTRLDYVILSHPHKDHVLLLPEIIDSFEVGEVWDSGALNETCVYYAFLKAVQHKQENGGLIYRTALYNKGYTHMPVFRGSKCYGPAGSSSDTPHLVYGDQLLGAQRMGTDTTAVTFADGATMTVLHATDPTASDYRANDRNYNDFSFVVQFNLAGKKVLLTGDAQGGNRETPMDHPDEDGTIEKKLLDCCMDLLPSDFMVVGHHGSETSSRDEFLDAVDDRDTRSVMPHEPMHNKRTMFYAVSSGPHAYSRVELPDSVVISDLRARFSSPDDHVFRTDLHDQVCSAAHNNVKPCALPPFVPCRERRDTTKIGGRQDGPYGGCDNIRAIIDDSGIRVTYWPRLR